MNDSYTFRTPSLPDKKIKKRVKPKVKMPSLSDALAGKKGEY